MCVPRAPSKVDARKLTDLGPGPRPASDLTLDFGPGTLDFGPGTLDSGPWINMMSSIPQPLWRISMNKQQGLIVVCLVICGCASSAFTPKPIDEVPFRERGSTQELNAAFREVASQITRLSK